jgi:polyhydroxyalkanoate synthesis regulator phasin
MCYSDPYKIRKAQTYMLQLVKKTAFMGIGLASMSALTIRRLGNKIAEDAKLSGEEGQKLVDDLLEQSEKSKEELKENIRKTVKDSISEMDLATVDDVDSINDRLDMIEETLEGSDENPPEPVKRGKGRPKSK